jgi:hypothetical protein
VTLYENVKPNEAASGRVGLASGIGRRWTAGTAMYDAAAEYREQDISPRLELGMREVTVKGTRIAP